LNPEKPPNAPLGPAPPVFADRFVPNQLALQIQGLENDPRSELALPALRRPRIITSR
jgi:hypothetical protein